MENPQDKIDELKASMDTLLDSLKSIRKQMKAEKNREYARLYSKKKYDSSEEYRKKQNDNAKARYYRLKKTKQQEE